MRLRTTIMTSFTAVSDSPRLAWPNLSPHGPDGEHGNDDRHELQGHAPSHQLLRGVGRAAPHHVDETEQQHQRDGAHGDRKDECTEKGSHRRYITPCPALRHLRYRWHGF